MKENIVSSFFEAKKVLDEFLNNQGNMDIVTKIAEEMAECFKKGNKILIAGNGGSACDAMHFAEEFTGRYRKNRKALPVISLTDSSHITCVGNDFGFDSIFSRGVEAYGKEGDFFVGISTSGNSANIIKAIEKASELKMKTFSLLGKDGGKIKGTTNFEIIINGNTSDRIQEVHMTILHIIIEGVERMLFPELY